MSKKKLKKPAKDSGKLKSTVREAKENLKKIEKEIEKEEPKPSTATTVHSEALPTRAPEPAVEPVITPRPLGMPVPPLLHSFKDPDLNFFNDAPFANDVWGGFLDKLAAFGLCGGFVCLGIVIGIRIHP